MSSSPSPLPENRQELVKIIDSLTTKNEQLEAKVRWFEEQFHLSSHKQFGPSSERSIKEQPNLFNEAEAIAEDGRIEISNNRAERSIKPFVIGRKNWLFCNTPKGARASAIIYSIVETAKENGPSNDHSTQH
jgi:hypothetical protein